MAGLVLIAACIPAEAPTSTAAAGPVSETAAPTSTTSASTTTTTSPPPALTTSTTRVSETAEPRPIPPCLTPDRPFGDEGEVGSYSPTGSDSAILASIDWQSWGECERFLFSMASPEGAPTLVPPSALLTSFAERGVVRLQLGEGDETSAVSYQLVNTPLVDRIYVVKAPDAGLIVDLHVSEPVSARMIASSAPATLTLDLRAGNIPFSRTPVVGAAAVLFLPSSREAIHYPFTVNGYLRPGIDESVATLTGPDGAATEARFPLAGADDLWSSFVAVFLEGPTGWATLQVEDAQARVFFEN